MEKLDRMLAEWECTKLSHAFAYHLDQRNYAEVANLFAPSGVWIRHGVPLKGREGILAALSERPSNRFTRHVTTSFHFTHIDDGSARSVAYNVSYFSLDADILPARYEPENFLLFDFIDRYEKTPEGWLFAERTSSEIMVSDKVRSLLTAHR